jgi:hypothetical protein
MSFWWALPHILVKTGTCVIRDELFNNIEKGVLIMPKRLSTEAKELIIKVCNLISY